MRVQLCRARPVPARSGRTFLAGPPALVAVAPALRSRLDAVRRFDDTPLATLVAAAPATAGRIARQVLGGCWRCAATSRACCWRPWRPGWWPAGRPPRPPRGCSSTPDTVRHRLRRIAQRTGRDLDQSIAVAELSAALHAVRLLPEVLEMLTTAVKRQRCLVTDRRSWYRPSGAGWNDPPCPEDSGRSP